MKSVGSIVVRAGLVGLAVAAATSADAGDDVADAKIEPTEFTLEQIRDGLEAAWSQTQIRRIRFVHTPFGVEPEEATPDHPNRAEYEICRAPGRHLQIARFFRANGLARSTVDAYDGETTVTINPDQRVALPTYQCYKSPQRVPDIRFESDLASLHFNVPYHELLERRGARVLGEVSANGHRCVRVQTFKYAVSVYEQHQVILDIDPAKGFRPRRVRSRRWETSDAPGPFNAYPTGDVEQFKQWDGVWYPVVIRQGDRYTYILEAEFNRTYPRSLFHLKPEPGMKVIDGERVYVAGGEAGRQIRHEALRKLGNPADHLPTKDERPWRDYFKDVSWQFWLLLGFGGAVTLAGGIAAWRARGSKGSPPQAA